MKTEPVPGLEGPRERVEAQVRVTLRPFVPADLDRVVQIERASFPVDAYAGSQFKSFYSRHPGEFFVVELHGEVVGYVTGSITGDSGEIESIAVDARVRGRGIGWVLVERILNRFRARGLQKCVLQVRTANTEAIDLYERLGFRIMGTLRAYYADGADAFSMERTLEPEGASTREAAGG